MASAELRMMDSAPATLIKVKTLKHSYPGLYRMKENDFKTAVLLALKLNIRDGYCQNIKKETGR